jgi:hypothetical protein
VVEESGRILRETGVVQDSKRKKKKVSALHLTLLKGPVKLVALIANIFIDKRMCPP